MKRQKGFSIIDGIFILAIVVLLSSIVVPHVQKARAHNQLEICVNNIKEMVTGINLYKADHPEFSGTIICSNSNPSPELVPDYISSIPTCPVSNPECGYDDYHIEIHKESGCSRTYVRCCGCNHYEALNYMAACGEGPCWKECTAQGCSSIGWMPDIIER